MEEAINALQKQTETLRVSYEASETAVPWSETLCIVQSIEELGKHMGKRVKRENDASNAVESRLERIENALYQLALGKEENEENKRGSYAEAAIRGYKAAPPRGQNKIIAPKSLNSDRQKVVV